MRQLILCTTVLILCTVVTRAQTTGWRGLDRSPLDIAFFPDNFAHDRQEGEEAVVRVIYSRPQKKGRQIFGSMVPFGHVWRTGANETTEIKFYKDVTIGGKKVEAGTYSLFTIPGEKQWTIIINSDLDYWGAYSYRPENDVVRTSAKTKKLDQPVEAFTIQFDGVEDSRAVMKLVWDMTLVEVPVNY